MAGATATLEMVYGDDQDELVTMEWGAEYAIGAAYVIGAAG